MAMARLTQAAAILRATVLVVVVVTAAVAAGTCMAEMAKAKVLVVVG